MDCVVQNWQSIAAGLILAVAILIFFYYRGLKEIPRGLILIYVVLIEILLLCIFWKEIETFITTSKRIEWLKGLLPILMAAVPAYLLWHWRDMDKKEALDQGRHDLMQKERDLEQKERDIKLKEDDATWSNFIKYQKMAENEDNKNSESIRTAAIFALGEYYGREGTKFPRQVHVFFKKFLSDFWNKQEIYTEYLEILKKYSHSGALYDSIRSQKDHLAYLNYDIKEKPLTMAIDKVKKIKLPEYINAVHEIIREKSNEVRLNNKSLFHRDNKLSFEEFNLTNAVLSRANFSESNFRWADLTGANLFGVNFAHTVCEGANFNGTYLSEANLTYTVFDVRLNDAVMTGAILTGTYICNSNLNLADCNNAKYDNNTKFNKGVCPRKIGMINVDELENKVIPKDERNRKNTKEE